MQLLQLFNNLKRAKDECGSSILKQISEMAILALGKGRLSPSEYFDYRLFDDRFHTFDSKKKFYGYKLCRSIDEKYNNRGSWILTADKSLFYLILKAMDIPHPECYAVVSSDGRKYLGHNHISNVNQFHDFLSNHERYPIFAKPIFGSFGRGAFIITGYEREKRLVRISGGNKEDVRDLFRNIASFSKSEKIPISGFLLQETLVPHGKIYEKCGSNISGVRVIMLNEVSGPELIGGVWKVTVGDNFVDNFSEGRYGNMLGHIDLNSGSIIRVHSGSGFSAAENPLHPDTGSKLSEFEIPCWQQLRDICTHAASIAPGIKLQHWDVAVTDRGPVILELNVMGSLDLFQYAANRGVGEILN